MNARLLAIFAAFALLVVCASSQRVKASRCNHHEKVASSRRLSGRYGDVEQRQNYWNAENKTTIGPLRIFISTRSPIYDKLDDYTFACSEIGQEVVVNSKTYKCTREDIIGDRLNDVLDFMSRVIDRFNKMLDVVQIQGNLTIEDDVYGEFVKIPKTIQRDCDLYIIQTFRPDSSDVVGSGVSLVHDQNGRPVVGHINWNPKNVDVSKAAKLMGNVALHSIIHILGFSQERMLDFRDYSTATNESELIQPYQDLQIVGRTYDNREMTLLTSTHATQEFRKHFGCSSAEGAVLEDQGGAEIAGSHWEMSMLMDELMTATVTEHSVLTNITLAALEDSGWYHNVKYSYGQHLVWGYQKGCSFITNRCNSSWPKGNGYYCTVQGEEDCTYDRKAIGSCDLRSWMSIPEKYQYFRNSHLGGPVEYADFCPFSYPVFFCDESTSSETKYGEAAGSDSRCFFTTLTKSVDNKLNPKKPLCYPHHCWSSSEYAVKVGNYWYSCPSNKEITNIVSFNGSLWCADADLLCSQAEKDNKFPVFISIEPNSAEPGTKIRITGKNLGPGTTVALGASCESPTYDSSTGSITCTVSGKVMGVKNLILKQNDFSLVVPNAFTLTSGLISWVTTNWFFAICAGVSVVVLIGACIIITCKCCCKARKWKKYQKSKGYAASRQNSAAQKAAASRNEFADDIDMDDL